MENLNKAIMHYNRDKFFTRDMLIGIEDEIPGSLSGDIVLSTLDDRVIIDDKIYDRLLSVQLDQMKSELNDSDNTD